MCALRERYRLAFAVGWWEDQVQVEALAALAAWVDRYDSRRVGRPAGQAGAAVRPRAASAVLLRDGGDPFHPDRDRLAFARHLIELGCQPPPGSSEQP